MNVSQVQELLYIQAISNIPNVPAFIEGAINLRGKIVQVINMRKWLKLPFHNFDENSRIIILQGKQGLFGILADNIYEVFNVTKSMHHEIPGMLLQDSGIVYLNSIIFKENQIFLEINPLEIKVE